VEKPIVAEIPESMARPFVYDYCRRWKIPFDYDENFDYGHGVLWMGAFYKSSLRAVIGLIGFEEFPDELYVYGFYGDGTAEEKRPLRGLVDFLLKMPHAHKYHLHNGR
jgi:hypothetical protein